MQWECVGGKQKAASLLVGRDRGRGHTGVWPPFGPWQAAWSRCLRGLPRHPGPSVWLSPRPGVRLLRELPEACEAWCSELLWGACHLSHEKAQEPSWQRKLQPDTGSPSDAFGNSNANKNVQPIQKEGESVKSSFSGVKSITCPSHPQDSHWCHRRAGGGEEMGEEHDDLMPHTPAADLLPKRAKVSGV